MPHEARCRLTAKYRARSRSLPEALNSSRSLPLARESWAGRLAALRASLTRVEDAAAPAAYETWTYMGLSGSLARLEAARLEIIAMLVALAPFDARDLDSDPCAAGAAWPQQEAAHHTNAMPGSQNETPDDSPASAHRTKMLQSEILEAVDRVLDEVLNAIDEGAAPPRVSGRLSVLTPSVPTIAVPDRAAALAVAFGMDTVPVDGDGLFSASRVFEAYKYANSPLIARLVTHMQALGLQAPADPLAMVLIVGWVVQAPDPVLAWQALRSTVIRLRHAKPRRNRLRLSAISPVSRHQCPATPGHSAEPRAAPSRRRGKTL